MTSENSGKNLSLFAFIWTKTKALYSDNLHFLDKSLNPPRTWRDAVINFYHQYHFLQSNFPIISLNSSTEWLARNFIFVDIWFLFSIAIIRYTFTFCQLESRMHAYLSLSYSYAKTAASRDAKYDHHHPRSGLTPTCGGTRPSTTTWRTSGCRPPGSGNLTYSCTTGRRRIFCR